MKTIWIILLITLIYIGFVFPASWHRYILESGGCGENAICLDSNDMPHILYYKNDAGVLRYASWDGSKWIYETISDDNKWYGGILSMAFDKNDIPHISFYEWNYGDLMYGYKDGDKWVVQIVDGQDDAGMFNSISLDSKGYPHIAYIHSIYTNPYREELKYAYYDGTKWNIEVVDNEMREQGDYCSIALDSKDHPHIVYEKATDDTNYNHNLYYAYYDGNNWIKENIYYLGHCHNPYNSIFIDSEDRPHISFYKGLQPGPGLYYGYKDGEKWNTEYLDEGYISSIKLDDKEYPCIAYSYESKLKFARWNGSKWDIEVAWAGRSPGEYSVSLAFDKDYNPHISCDGYIDEDAWYIWYGNNLAIDLTSFSAKPHNNAITLNWSVSTDEQISGFNLYRRIATPHTNSNPVRENSYSPTCSPATVGEIATFPLQTDDNSHWTKVNTSLITGTNPYSYTDRDIMPNTNYEYKLEAVVYNKNETLGATECTSENPSSFDITIYPNPSSGTFTLKYKGDISELSNIKIYDISGRLVKDIDIPQSDTESVNINDNTSVREILLDISDIKDGLYIIGVGNNVYKKLLLLR